MAVPLVAAFAASTSAYGRLARLPPVAGAASAGWAASSAVPAMPAVASETELNPTRSSRLRLRSFGAEWNTIDPLDVAVWRRVGDRERCVVDIDAKLIDI